MTEAPDLIEPPAAREPAEVLLLACAALTDGDFEAAVALYEPDATLSWGQDHSAAGHAAIRQVLSGVMDMRLPLRARAVRVLLAGPLALITGERALTGTGLDGVAVTLSGPTALAARSLSRHPGTCPRASLTSAATAATPSAATRRG